MASILSERQKDELHKAMLDYLSASDFSATLDAFKSELPNGTDFAPDPKAKWAGLLEKKWTSVIRLQKKIMDLEKENAALKEELSTAGSSSRKTKDEDWVPGRSGGARHILTGHRSPVTAVAFHPLFSNVVSASEDSSLKVWDYESGDFEVTLKGHTKAVCDVDYDSKGLLIVSCSSDLTLKLWDTSKSHQCIKTLHDHDHSVSGCRFVGPADAYVVSASRDSTIKVWEVSTSHCVRTLRGHAEWVRGVWPALDGRSLVSAANDQTARIWDLATGETKLELRGHEHVVECAAFAPPSAHAALRELAGIAPVRGGKGTLPFTAFVATGSRDKTIRLWDGQTGQCIKTLIGHDNWVRALVFHPNGKTLLSASDDRTLRAWDLRTGRCSRTVVDAHDHFVTCLAWARAPAGGSLPTADTPSGDAAATVNGTAPKGVDGLAVAVVKPVMVLASGGVDTFVKVWSP